MKVCKICHQHYEDDGKPCPHCYPAGPKQSKETIIWHPSPSMPKSTGWYLVTRISGIVSMGYFREASTNINSHWDDIFFIIAWAELPKGWKPQ